MTIEARVRCFHDARQEYNEIADEKRTILNSNLENLEASSSDFGRLLDVIISTESITHPNFKDFQAKKRNMSNSGAGCVIAGAVTYDYLIECIVSIGGKEPTLCEKQRVYSIIPHYTRMKAHEFIQRYMGEIEQLRQFPNASEEALQRLRDCQKVLVELGACLPEQEVTKYTHLPVELRPPYFQEVNNYLTSGVQMSLSSTCATQEMELCIRSLKQYQCAFEEKAELTVKKLKLIAEVSPYWGLSACMIPDGIRLKNAELGEVNLRFNSINLEPLHGILERSREFLIRYERESPEDVTRFLGIARFLVVLDSTNRVAVKNQLLVNVSEIEGILEIYLKEVPKALGNISIIERSKQALLGMIAREEQDVRNTSQLLGFNQGSAVENLAADAEAAQVINDEIQQCSQYLAQILVNNERDPIQPIMLQQVANRLREIVLGFEKEDPIFQQVNAAARNLMEISKQAGMEYAVVIVSVNYVKEQLETILVQERPQAVVAEESLEDFLIAKMNCLAEMVKQA